MPPQQPWVEKHRPRVLADIAFQEEVTNALTSAVEKKVLPHMLFYGPPGTGKTSTILAVAREIYGPLLLKMRVLELNASYVIRGEIAFPHPVPHFVHVNRAR